MGGRVGCELRVPREDEDDGGFAGGRALEVRLVYLEELEFFFKD